MRDPRLKKLAEVLVNYSVGVKRGQLVRISSPTVAEPLAVEIFREVVRAGGHPMARMTADDFEEIFFKTGSDEQLDYLNPIAKSEIETIDCSIGIWADENTKGADELRSEADGAERGGAKADHGCLHAAGGGGKAEMDGDAVSLPGQCTGRGYVAGGI